MENHLEIYYDKATGSIGNLYMKDNSIDYFFDIFFKSAADKQKLTWNWFNSIGELYLYMYMCVYVGWTRHPFNLSRIYFSISRFIMHC